MGIIKVLSNAMLLSYADMYAYALLLLDGPEELYLFEGFYFIFGKWCRDDWIIGVPSITSQYADSDLELCEKSS